MRKESSHVGGNVRSVHVDLFRQRLAVRHFEELVQPFRWRQKSAFSIHHLHGLYFRNLCAFIRQSIAGGAAVRFKRIHGGRGSISRFVFSPVSRWKTRKTRTSCSVRHGMKALGCLRNQQSESIEAERNQNDNHHTQRGSSPESTI